MSLKQSNSKFSTNQHIRNLISNILLVGINLLISFWYTPYLIRNLGSELFGFIPLTDSVIYFFGIFTLSFNVSISRFLTIELEKGEYKNANIIFNTTLLTTLVIITVVTPLGIILMFLFPQIFHFPAGQAHNIQLLFTGSFVAFFLTTVQTNFSIATFTSNRFDLKNIVSLVARVVQVLAITLLFTIDSPSLVWVGIGTLTAAIASLIGDFYLWKRLLPNIHLDATFFDKKYLSTLFRTSFWMLVYQLGFIIFINVDMLVANRTMTLSLAGMYGALLLIPKNLRILANAVGGIWGPSILSRYSKADYRGMDSLAKFSIKITGLATALPVGLLVGYSRPFLILWLGPDFNIMTWALIFMVVHLSATLVTSPFYNVQLSLNKIKWPALMNVLTGIIYFTLAYFLSLRYDALGIAMAGAICLLANNMVFSPVYTAKLMQLGSLHYFKRLLFINMTGILVALVSYAMNLLLPPSSLMDLAWMGLLISGIYAAFVYFLALNRDERDLLLKIVKDISIIRKMDF